MDSFDEQSSLSNGFFQNLISNSYPAGFQPVLQIIESRVIPGSNILRLRLSDGLFSYANCASSLEIAKKLDDEGYTTSHGIIKVTEFVRSTTGGKVGFTIGDYKCMQLTNTIIGDPKPHSGNPDDYRGIENFPVVSSVAMKPEQENGSPSRKRGMMGQGSNIQSKRPSMPSGGVFTGGLLAISMVTPYANAFKICGAASMKESPRTISTKRGPSTVFSFALTDTDGSSIKISAFGNECNKFADLIQDGQVRILNRLQTNSHIFWAYYVTCTGSSVVREANKRFNSTGHTYEMTLNSQCNVELCNDRDIGTPAIKLNVMQLVDIKHHANECVDVLAIVEKVDEIGSVTAKATQQQLKRRNVTLIDKSCTQVTMTLWGDEGVEKVTPEHIGQVIGVKGASVREFNGGFSLSLASASVILNAPDGSNTNELYRWFSEDRPSVAIGSLTAADSGGSFEQECRIIHSLNHTDLDSLDRGMFASVHGFINVIKAENISYMACPTDNCKKKVTPEAHQWRCSACGLFDSHKTLYMLSVEIGDFSGLTWLTLFDEPATVLLGISAEKLVDLQQSDRNAYDEVLQKNRYKNFEFRVRVAIDNYNDQKRTRWSCMNVRPINHERYNKALKKTIDALA